MGRGYWMDGVENLIKTKNNQPTSTTQEKPNSNQDILEVQFSG